MVEFKRISAISFDRYRRNPIPLQQDKTVCSRCKGTGWTRKAREEGKIYPSGYKTELEACLCTLEKRAIQNTQKKGEIFECANIPGYARNWTFATYPERFQQEDQKNLLKNYAYAFTQGPLENAGLLLYGPGGRGKTSLAISFLRYLLAKEYTGLFLPEWQLFTILREAAQEAFLQEKDEGGISAREISLVTNQALRTIKVLILDELGLQPPTPNVIRELYTLVEYRRAYSGLFTIFTTNLTLWELKKKWGAEGKRILDRIGESYPVVEMDGITDLRTIH